MLLTPDAKTNAEEVGDDRRCLPTIYTGMLGMIVVAGLAWSHWIGFLIALLLFAIGTAIRVHSEEKLLRESFGAEFDDYKRSVPAVIPIKF